jgi:Rad3-related DNA helicase
MKRLQFDSSGKLISVDNSKLDNYQSGYKLPKNIANDEDESGEEKGMFDHLLKSEDLQFLKDYEEKRTDEEDYWSLYSDGKKLEPLRFSNGKTQSDVVKEVVGLVKEGTKVIFIHGVCGTGKSAIALNIARVLGRTSLVVPVKSLQRQYEEDYMGKKYVLKKNKKLKIAMITGRDNHDSVFKSGVSCADPFLPETIKFTEKNYKQIFEYYEQNPIIKNKLDHLDLKNLKRFSVAPSNPYWSPIIDKEFQVPLNDAIKKKYEGLDGREFIFYHRQKGCSYYDQYQAYLDADVIIFNAAKYKIETGLNRKPATEVEIIDEADEFLDSFSTQEELNLTRLNSSLRNVIPDNTELQFVIDKLVELISLEEKNKAAIGVDEDKIYKIQDTKMLDLLKLIIKKPELEVELSFDELNYGNKAIEVANGFKEFLDDTYLTFKKRENDLVAHFVSTNLSKKFQEMIDKNKTIILMSGTLHSDTILKNVYGLKDYKIVEAETFQQGNIEIHRTGKEIDCRYSNFSSKKHTREQYYQALQRAVESAKRPTLIHVNSFEDLPSEREVMDLGLTGVVSKERLISLQAEDKNGKLITLFKSKLSPCLFTTKCSRGVDFPGDMCNSIIFTKYPNPNVQGTFWKILQQTHPNYYWDFYRDKARREFLQRIYRAVRSKEDHVYILSPDLRVIEAVKEIQKGRLS